MDKASLASVPGSAFGAEGYFRMAFSETEIAIREGLIALKKALTT
jgi:aspartate/methionine/tyrosine aminotransferase